MGLFFRFVLISFENQNSEDQEDGAWDQLYEMNRNNACHPWAYPGWQIRLPVEKSALLPGAIECILWSGKIVAVWIAEFCLPSQPGRRPPMEWGSLLSQGFFRHSEIGFLAVHRNYINNCRWLICWTSTFRSCWILKKVLKRACRMKLECGSEIAGTKIWVKIWAVMIERFA